MVAKARAKLKGRRSGPKLSPGLESRVGQSYRHDSEAGEPWHVLGVAGGFMVRWLTMADIKGWLMIVNKKQLLIMVDFFL